MKKLLFLFGWAILISEIAIAQKELNNWFFGNNAGLNFNSGTPNFLPGGKVVSAAGSSSISDDQGKLLFYSDGLTVWNKNHQPMPNGTGLNGNLGSTQTVLITYYPGNKDLYYIFTVDKAGGSNGLQYSIIDMRLNGGLGDIDVTLKNVPFNLPVTEKIAAVKNKNGRDLWLIVHAYNSNLFFVYSIDCQGGFTPKVYTIGSMISSPDNARGYMKASPDGTKLVSANFTGDFEMFDFDNATGGITNVRVIPTSSGTPCGPYGMEFSPDSKLLYLSEVSTCTFPFYRILQYKLDPNINNIIASKVLLNSGSGNFAGALQLGPDNKIYIAYDGATYLGVINNANVYGTGCTLVKQGLLLQAPATSSFGLPNAIAGFQRNTLSADTTVCDGTPFTIKLALPASTYLWSDGSKADSLVVTKSGKYWVDIISTNANGANCLISDTINITFKSSPKFSLGNDTVVCQDKLPLMLAPALPAATYLWQDGTTKASYSVNAPGLYWLQAATGGCLFSDSILITTAAGTPFSLGADTSICTGDSLKLTANIIAFSYLWNTGSTANSINIKAAGIYWCEARYANGCSYRDSIRITLTSLPVFNLGKDTTLCQNQLPYLINQTITGAYYLWQDGSTGSSFSASAAGTYWLQATVNGCSSRDSIAIKVNSITAFNLGADTTLCTGNPLVLTVTPAFTKYLWSTGSTLKSINVSTGGTYWCEAINSSGCAFSDSINVAFKFSPVINLGNDTSLCPNAFPLVIGQAIAGANYIWQDGSANAMYSVARPGSYSVQVTANGCFAKDTILITANTVNSFTLGADTTLCSPSPFTLKANVTAANYLWSTGSTAQSITVNNSGDYWCEINRGTGCGFRDTVKVVFAAPIVFSLGKDTVICNNSTLLLNVDNKGDTYTWQDNSKQSQYLVSKSGTYYVAVSKGACVTSDTIVVTYSAQTLPDLGTDKTICPGEEILLNANVSASSYLWQDGSTSRIYKVTSPGTYKVEVMNECGKNSDEIIISSGSCKLMIPNAFTPGKSPNDIFRVLRASGVKDFNLQVFSRWGQQVYHTNKLSEGWDGKYNGVEQPAGTYIYMVSYTDNTTGRKDFQKGTVILVR
jgi:gliding motility-associated-like protein